MRGHSSQRKQPSGIPQIIGGALGLLIGAYIAISSVMNEPRTVKAVPTPISTPIANWVDNQK